MTQHIVIGTSNHHKFCEIEQILHPVEIGVELVFGGNICDNVPEETGSDFFDNAFLKAHSYANISGMPAIADDSGLIVDALDGAPGIFSARYAGEGCTYADNNRKLLAEMLDVPDDKRAAKFICTVVLYFPDGRRFCTEGTLAGRIAYAARGAGGFGYDPIFELPNGHTVAELPSEVKNAISHRAKAFLEMAKILKAIFIGDS